MLGLLRQWQALESWAAAGKLGVLRALVRDDGQPLPGGGYHGDLPDGWTKSLTHEVALALSMPAASAEKLMWLAWNLHALLPGTGALLAAGELSLAKARAVDSALNLLSEQDAAAAEAVIVPELPGKTYGQVQSLAVQAALTVDPESATKRREDAERNKCRVRVFREETGAAGLSGRDMPTAQTLAAHASVCARAQEYKDSRVFPDDTRMDQFRVAAYLDLLNGVPVKTRIASGQLETARGSGWGPGASAEGETDPGSAGKDTATGAGADTVGTTDTAEPDATDLDESHSGSGGATADGDEYPCGECDGRGLSAEGGGLGDDPDIAGSDGGPSDGSPRGGTPCSPGSPGGTGSDQEHPPRLADLVLPLATLLGLAERPGEGHGLGPLDPALCRELAIAAAGSPWTRLCITVTDPDGTAIGHGCARSPRQPRTAAPARANPPPGFPARLNLTITAARLAELAATTAPPGNTPWSLAQSDDSRPPGGFGTWTLTLPDGRQFTVRLEQVPTFDCDHRHESHAYQPNAALRHLVQIRDYECTFPTCSRHARESDFEHAIPYDRGGKTCACNAGARSRACHRIKQSPGWNVTQPRPGWHQWTTPSGRTYTQHPKRYPA